MNYLDNVKERTKEYFKMLEPDFPEWLVDYINTESLLKQQYISITCGTIYSDLFESDYFFFEFRSCDRCCAYNLAFYS